MKDRPITMAEIAQLAGVSKSTVSRVLLDSPLVGAETRHRVQSLMRERRYTPNINATSLRTMTTRIVSVIVPLLHDDRQTMSDPFFMRMIGSLCDALSRRGYDLLLSKLTSNGDRDIGHLVRQNRADGIILIGQSSLNAQISAIAVEELPLVVWGARLPRQSYATVACDNRKGAHAAVTHLLHQSRTRIAFLGNPDLPETRLRFDGYRAALRSAGIPADPALVVPMSFDRDGAFEAAGRFVASSVAFDAVFAVSDVIARCVIDALLQAGRTVPGDVAVVGFDDIDGAAASILPLTTVRQDITAAAEALVTLLLEQIAGEPRRSVILPTRLIVRASSVAKPE